MRATISTAPTPFDSCTKEELHDWLSDPVTQKLMVAIEQHIANIDDSLLNGISYGTVEEAGAFFLDMKRTRFALTNVRDWIKGANRA